MTAALAARGLLAAAALAAAGDILYNDEKYNRIPNRRLLIFLGLGLTGYAALFAATTAATAFGGFGMSYAYLPAAFFTAAAAQALLSAATAVLLWRLGRWPAGDAKLFAVASVWLTLADPGSPLLPWRLPLVFLMNIFIPAAVFILVRTAAWVWHEKLRHRAGFWKQMGLRRVPEYLRDGHRELKTFLIGALTRWRDRTRQDPTPAAGRAADLLAMAAAGAVVTVWLGPRLGLRLPGPFLAVAACLAWDALRRLTGSRASWVLCAAGLAAAGWGQPPEAWARLAGGWAQWVAAMLVMEAGMLAGRVFLGVNERIIALLWIVPLALGVTGLPHALLGMLGVGEAGLLRWAGVWLALGTLYALVSTFFEEDVDRLPPERFHAWLVPAAPTLALLRSEPAFFAEHFSRLYPDGMTPSQAEALADFCRRRGLPDALFRKTAPFARWIFVGGALTYHLRRDVLNAFLSAGGG